MPFLTLKSIEPKLSILDISSSERSAARLAFNSRFASSHLYPKGVLTRNFSAAPAAALLEEAEDDPAELLLLPAAAAVDDDDDDEDDEDDEDEEDDEEEGGCGGGAELGRLASWLEARWTSFGGERGGGRGRSARAP
jgi:hypothetical protein